jgi:hypothetical protein
VQKVHESSFYKNLIFCEYCRECDRATKRTQRTAEKEKKAKTNARLVGNKTKRSDEGSEDSEGEKSPIVRQRTE